MAKIKTAEKSVENWLDGKRTMLLNSMRVSDSGAELQSYGPHFVLAFTDNGKQPDTVTAPNIWVNTDDYYPTYAHRTSKGWGHPTNRTPAHSPSTRRHQRAVMFALQAAGYKPLPGKTGIYANNHTYQLWTADRCEQCEENPVLFPALYCGAGCKNEAYIEYRQTYGEDPGEFEPDTYSDADPGL